MKIGEKTYRLSRPTNLDEQLVEMTGCAAHEMPGLLRGSSIASTIAAALLPHISGDKPGRHALAEEIAAAGIDDVRRDVLALYEKGAEDGEQPKEDKPGK